ncbi:DUF998 domain-containing protein [Alteromonas stellipolaris]|uniref:DUF998 domain-containing protein n=1 Tax=Alteromonas stellipolaris TaxID=233316 RepID=UPI002735739E|nr:DUF998 domain-containing protein [Alteromonas stellipolaris]MDP2596187.1 DUF998 domain-containing protein [Alteromonas stellipolaris]
MFDLLSYTGIIASIWIVVGIYIASLYYPNYSHTRQFCSELGAFGSPTQKLSPAINNYPLGLLFVLFGYYLIAAHSSNLPSTSLNTTIVGIMVIVHGVCTWVCGFFPMDADPYTPTPTASCKIHTWSGLIMLISFIVAPAIVMLSSVYPIALRLFSFNCILGCFFYSYKLSDALKAKTHPGLYQRLSYGFQILWLFVYSLYLIK